MTDREITAIVMAAALLSRTQGAAHPEDLASLAVRQADALLAKLRPPEPEQEPSE